MKTSLITLSVVVALTLAIWLFFYYASEPLSGPGTTVVAGVSVAFVYGAKWLGRVLTNWRRQR